MGPEKRSKLTGSADQRPTNGRSKKPTFEAGHSHCRGGEFSLSLGELSLGRLEFFGGWTEAKPNLAVAEANR